MFRTVNPATEETLRQYEFHSDGEVAQILDRADLNKLR